MIISSQTLQSSSNYAFERTAKQQRNVRRDHAAAQRER